MEPNTYKKLIFISFNELNVNTLIFDKEKVTTITSEWPRGYTLIQKISTIEETGLIKKIIVPIIEVIASTAFTYICIFKVNKKNFYI